MKYNFCQGCPEIENIPLCAINYIPYNPRLEEIINDVDLNYTEVFVCHKNAQEINDNILNVKQNCDACGLCMVACTKYKIDNYKLLLTPNMEKVIFNDLPKASVLFQTLFPNTVVATEVQVKGNFRTKRIDLVIKNNSSVLLIKLLKNLDKAPYYSRSYNDVINYYRELYPNLSISSACLVPSIKSCASMPNEIVLYDINSLYHLLGGV